jgi:hypothetical protein
MNALVELIISLVDYLHAEFQDGRQGLLRLACAILLVAAAVVFLAAGLGLMLAALYFALRTQHGAPVAALLTALAAFLMAGVLGWCGKQKAGR